MAGASPPAAWLKRIFGTLSARQLPPVAKHDGQSEFRMITAADIATRKPGDWHDELEPFVCALFGRASPPAKGFAWVWNKRNPGTVGIVDPEKNVGLVFQLLSSGKLLLLPHHVLVDHDLIAGAIRERNPPTDVHSN